MKINWKDRMKNKAFWVSIVSAMMLLAQELGLELFPENTMDILNTVLVILTIMGVIVDPTTNGIGDNTEDKDEEDIGEEDDRL